jgi:hypothetical protein
LIRPDAIKFECDPKAFGAMFANIETIGPFFNIATP